MNEAVDLCTEEIVFSFDRGDTHDVDVSALRPQHCLGP